jgi:hypothetical protein
MKYDSPGRRRTTMFAPCENQQIPVMHNDRTRINYTSPPIAKTTVLTARACKIPFTRSAKWRLRPRSSSLAYIVRVFMHVNPHPPVPAPKTTVSNASFGRGLCRISRTLYASCLLSVCIFIARHNVHMQKSDARSIGGRYYSVIVSRAVRCSK